MTVRRVILCRHGRTTHNHAGMWQGQLDTELDDTGRVQARQAGEALRRMVGEGDQVVVLTSDLRRASETAAFLAQDLGVAVSLDERLREIDVGRWQGLTRAEIVAAGMGESLDRWLRGEEDVPAGEGERRSEAGQRGSCAVREHVDSLTEGTLVVVSHGAILRATALALLGMPMVGGRWLGALRNCHWAELAPGEPTWRMLAYNVGAEPGAAPSAW